MEVGRWSFHPDALLVIGAIAVLYGVAVRNAVAPRWRLACFGGGLGLLLVSHVTPLGSLATESLLSAHLLQNVVFAEWAPALLVLGVPPALAERAARLPGARTLTHPVVALTVWVGTYAAWHVPAAYDAALRHQSWLLQIEHVTYLAAGVLLWWPVFQASPRRLSDGVKAIYLLAAFMLASPLGILLTLLPSPVYDFYVDAPDVWGLSDLADQQIAGATMTVAESVLFFCLGGYYLVRFLREEEARQRLRDGESSQIA